MNTAIIIDCSAIFYQVISRICGYNGKNIKNVVESGRKYLTLEKEQKSFLQDMHNEFDSLNKYSAMLNTTGIYFAFDSVNAPSFRFHVYPEYKKSKSRSKEQVYDKVIFKKLIGEYCDVLRENGFKVIEWDGIEADDIFFEFKKIIPDHTNIGIITPDSDIDQLLDHRTFIYNPVNYVTKVSSDFRMGGTYSNETGETDEFDFFFGNSQNHTLDTNYERFFSNKTVVCPKSSLFKKIIIGDDMDNIPSFFRYRTKTGKSEFAFTKDRYKQFEAKYPECVNLSMLNDDEQFLDLLSKFSDIVGRDLDTGRLEEYKYKKDFNVSMIDLSESGKYHKQSPELLGIIHDQVRKPEVNFGVVTFYERDSEIY